MEHFAGKQLGAYRIIGPMGERAMMGIVYRAEDIRSGRTVALRFISDQLAGDVAAKKRFERGRGPKRRSTTRISVRFTTSASTKGGLTPPSSYSSARP